MPKTRQLTERDWEQLLTIPAGYLPLALATSEPP